MKIQLLMFILATILIPSAMAEMMPVKGFYDVSTYGAHGDGVAKDTNTVQKTIDACSENGGGTVYFPPGTYLCGSLHLRSGVTLWMNAGAVIMGSPDNEDYDPCEKLGFENDSDHETSYFHHALIWGEDLERIAIIGQGIIDSNRSKRGGPKPIALKRCKYVDIKDIIIRNSPNYCISMLGTDYVNIDGVTILNGYCDGIDPDSCKNVRIANCHIESVDDAIVPKASFSLGERRATENIVVTNCVLFTVCNGFKLGTESGGDFKRIAVSNCVMGGFRGRPAISGVALESVDGSNLDGVVVSNITMTNCRAPIFIRLGNRGRDMDVPVPGSLKNVCIDNITATGGSLTSSITGIPGHPVENVIITNVQMVYDGGVPYCGVDVALPEMIDTYPDADMYEFLPAYGLYCRHVDGLTLSNVNLSYKDEFYRLGEISDRKISWNIDNGVPQPSAPGRPGNAMICDDVKNFRLENFQGRPSSQPEDAVIRLVNVQDVLIHGCIESKDTTTFLEVVGKDTGVIQVENNLLRSDVKILDANAEQVKIK